MEKFKIKIEETRKLHYYIIVEAEDGITVLNSLFRARKSGKKINLKYCVDCLERDGINVLKITEDKQGESILDCDEVERVE